jgi:uncharacterized phage-associated protein
MSHDARAVANYVLDSCARLNRVISNLSLQKIIFFCHAWCLVRLGKTLVSQPFEAWEYGPVLPCVYRDFSCAGASPINNRSVKASCETGEKLVVRSDFEPEVVELLEEVIAFYIRRSASELVRLSHVSGGPWFNAWNHSSNTNPGMRIENRDIFSFYAGKSVVSL